MQLKENDKKYEINGAISKIEGKIHRFKEKVRRKECYFENQQHILGLPSQNGL